MPTYQIFSLAVTEAKEYTLGGGTEAEWLAHVSEEPTNPSAVVKYASAAKATAKFRVSLKIAGTALNTALEAGEKVTAITYHFNLKGAVEAKTVKLGAVTPEDKSEPTIKIAQTWFSVTATEAHAKELTKAKLEELRLFCENILAKEAVIYEVYATVTTEVPAVKGSATGAMLFTGSAKGTAIQKVEGKATGPMLFTGTSKGLAVQVVRGSATGAMLFTGTAKGLAVQKVIGKATGAFLFTGTAKGSTTEGGGVQGKATGAMLFTGSASGVTRVQGKASGALLFTGSGKGTTRTGKAKRSIIFIFDE